MANTTKYYPNKYAPSVCPLNMNSTIVNRAKSIISQAWGLSKIIHHNPGPNPVSFERKHLTQIESCIDEFVVTEKSDGVRYLLVLGTAPDGIGFALMVNRKMEMYEIPVYAHPDYFKGSVFDGELVNMTLPDKASSLPVISSSPTGALAQNINNEPNSTTDITQQIFLVFDTIHVKGESRRNVHFMSRYKEYTSVFDLGNKDILECGVANWDDIAYDLAKSHQKIVCLGNRMALQFRPKQFVNLVNLGSMWRSTMPNLRHKTDGLIIQKTTTEVGTGVDHSIMKWKQKNTVDLIVTAIYVKKTWNYQLSFQHDQHVVLSTEREFIIREEREERDKDKNHQQQQPHDNNSNHTEEKKYRLEIKFNPILNFTATYFGESHKSRFDLLGEFECEIDKNKQIVWCVLERWRTDKETANNYPVIQKIIQNCHDNITINELLNLTSKYIYRIGSN